MIGTHRDAPIAFTQLPLPQMLALQAGLRAAAVVAPPRPLLAFGAIAVVFIIQWSLGVAAARGRRPAGRPYSLALHGRLRRLPWAGGRAARGVRLLVAVRLSAAVAVWDALFFLPSPL